MKKSASLFALFIVATASPVLGADLSAQKAPLVAPTAPPLWAGAYVGLNAGGTFGAGAAPHAQTWNLAQPVSNAGTALTALASGSATGASANAGFIGGGQIGYNWQIALRGVALVTGVEADIQGVAASAGGANRWTAANTDYFGQPVSLFSTPRGSANLTYIGTVRGRLGVTVTPTLLVYGTGGLAYGGVNASMQNSQLWVTTGGPKAGYNSAILGGSSSGATRVGWTAGGGVEWMFLPNWSAKAEYLYYDLGNVTGAFVSNYYGVGGFAGNSGVQNATSYTARASGNIARLGVNYHFNLGAPPVVAKF